MFHVSASLQGIQICILGLIFDHCHAILTKSPSVSGSDIKVKIFLYFLKTSGGRLNKKDGLTRYGNSHVKDKTS